MALSRCGVDGSCAAGLLEIGNLSETARTTTADAPSPGSGVSLAGLAGAIAPVAWLLVLMSAGTLLALEVVDAHYLKRLRVRR